MRSPDTSWISEQRWATVPDHQKEQFLPIVPDFIVEVRSPGDSLENLKAKMKEWIENGVRLGWLVDPKNKQTYIYRANGTIELVEGFDQRLDGEDVLEGFGFDLSRLRMP